jgi:TRAP transporter TAXI family solute receptor
MGKRVQSESAKKSLATHQSKQSGFSRTSNTAANTSSYRNNPVYNRGAQNRTSYDNYYAGRDRYYGGMGWGYPRYAYMSYPSFGMWDAMIWWSILDRSRDRHYYSMAHHHAQDPGYQEWRREAKRLAEDNEELKAKLAVLDQEVATMTGVPRDTNYLPPGVDPSVALAAEVVATADPSRPLMTIGTGVTNGNYHRFGKIMQTHLPNFDVTLEPSNGSENNLNSLVENQVDAVLVQSDMLNAYLLKHPETEAQLVGLQSTLYTEYVQLLVNKDSGIEAITELDSNIHIVYVGPRGSGTHSAWEGFVLQDPKYGEFTTRYASYEEALNQVSGSNSAVMLFVAGLNSPLLQEANDKYGHKVNIVTIDEKHFSTSVDQFGNTIYDVATIPDDTYPNLQVGWLFGFGDNSLETLSVDAVLILSKRWVDTYGSKPMTRFEDALWRSIDDIKLIVGK